MKNDANLVLVLLLGVATAIVAGLLMAPWGGWHLGGESAELERNDPRATEGDVELVDVSKLEGERRSSPHAARRLGIVGRRGGDVELAGALFARSGADVVQLPDDVGPGSGVLLVPGYLPMLLDIEDSVVVVDAGAPRDSVVVLDEERMIEVPAWFRARLDFMSVQRFGFHETLSELAAEDRLVEDTTWLRQCGRGAFEWLGRGDWSVQRPVFVPMAGVECRSLVRDSIPASAASHMLLADGSEGHFFALGVDRRSGEVWVEKSAPGVLTTELRPHDEAEWQQVDIHLPRMNGFATCASVIERFEGHSVEGLPLTFGGLLRPFQELSWIEPGVRSVLLPPGEYRLRGIFGSADQDRYELFCSRFLVRRDPVDLHVLEAAAGGASVDVRFPALTGTESVALQVADVRSSKYALNDHIRASPRGVRLEGLRESQWLFTGRPGNAMVGGGWAWIESHDTEVLDVAQGGAHVVELGLKNVELNDVTVDLPAEDGEGGANYRLALEFDGRVVGVRARLDEHGMHVRLPPDYQSLLILGEIAARNIDERKFVMRVLRPQDRGSWSDVGLVEWVPAQHVEELPSGGADFALVAPCGAVVSGGVHAGCFGGVSKFGSFALPELPEGWGFEGTGSLEGVRLERR